MKLTNLEFSIILKNITKLGIFKVINFVRPVNFSSNNDLAREDTDTENLAYIRFFSATDINKFYLLIHWPEKSN